MEEGAESGDWSDAATALAAKHDIRTAVVTLGGAGSVVVETGAEETGERSVTATLVEPLPVDVVDTTGCGDSYMGSLMAGLASGLGVRDSARVAAAGHRHVDAPVSGGISGAAAGTLAFMVGGDEADVERARPVLEHMGRSIVHCGDSGAGQAAKVCNNMVLAVEQIAIGEAMLLGEKLGLTPEAFHEVVSNSTGACWALTVNCPVPGPVPTSPANNGFKPGFATALMDKDLGLAEHALDTAGTSAPMGRLARELYSRFLADGNGGLDFSAIIEQTRADGAASDERN